MNYIMVVDDDPRILKLLVTGLQKAGYEVGKAENAEVALSKIVQKKPDLLITDAMMPGKDGYQLAKELRSKLETREMPIIMLTALQQEHDALKAFQDGVDDFITKPFRMPLLRARITALLNRSRVCRGETVLMPTPDAEAPVSIGRASIGVPSLDDVLGGGIPLGSNVLIVGETGSGKSTLGRRFITGGLDNSERCMVITLDDDPLMIRNSLDNKLCTGRLTQYEKDNYFRIVDSYSWNRGVVRGEEKFAVSGIIDLNQLAALISDAGAELGQNTAEKLGGRRIVDSISSLFINFELVIVQRFLAQLARTASGYGGVSSLFILEEGSVSERELNNIKYLMDAVIELKLQDFHMARVSTMKWSKFSREWVSIE
ncbi:response regulator [Chloroflexota bacterium]